MNIILSGTSSAGKTSIMNEFSNNYNKISMDNVFNEFGYIFFRICEYKNLKNKYYTQKEKDKFFNDCLYDKIIEKIKKNKNNIIDIVDDFDDNSVPILNKYIKQRIHILIYTDLDKLVENINKRKSYDPRGNFVFNQFSKYYIKTNVEDDAIDTINFNDFIKSLKKIKYEFESETALKKFAEKIFRQLGINRIILEKDYYIKPRSNSYNFVINTKNKSPKELHEMILSYIHK